MLALAFATLALESPTAGDDARPKTSAGDDDQKRMQGVWTMVENVVNGFPASETETQTWLLVVEDDEYNPGSGETSIEYRFTLDATLTPRSIDLSPLRDGERGKRYRGIYSIVGDTFTVCRPLDANDDRPAGFSARVGSNLSRVVWKRRKSR